MGLVYDSSDSSDLMTALNNNLKVATRVADRLNDGCRHLVDELNAGTLSGAAYTAGKGLFEDCVIPTVLAFAEAIGSLGADAKTYARANASVEEYGRIEEDSLTEMIQIKQQQIDATCHLMQTYVSLPLLPSSPGFSGIDDLTSLVGGFDSDIAKLQAELAALHEFDATTSSLFTGGMAMLETAMKAVAELDQATVDKNGTYQLPSSATLLPKLKNQILDSLSGKTPAQIAAWFAGLPASDGALLASLYPSQLGNLNGVPLKVRGTANWILLGQAIKDAEAHGDHSKYELLTGILEQIAPGGTLDPKATLVVFDPGKGFYGVLWGSPAAKNVGVFVPGVGDKSSVPGWVGTAKTIWQAAGSGSAVMMWDGYENPAGFPNAEVADSAFNGHAQVGAKALTAFCQGGLGLTRGQSLTIVGHSYGSVLTGIALSNDGLKPDRVVVAGSPGMGVDALSQLHLKPEQFYAERAPNDYVANNLGGFGADPTNPLFGGMDLKTNAPGTPQTSGHSDYFKKAHQSLMGIADVISGTVRPEDIQLPDAGDLFGTSITEGINAGSARPLLDLAAQHYDGPGSGVLQAGDHLANVINRNVAVGARDVVDGAEDGAEGVWHWATGHL